MLKRISLITTLLLLVLFVTGCTNPLAASPAGANNGSGNNTGADVWKIVKYGGNDLSTGNVTFSLNSDGTATQSANGVPGAPFNYIMNASQFVVSNKGIAGVSFFHNGTYTMTKTATTLVLGPIVSTTGNDAKTIEAIKQ